MFLQNPTMRLRERPRTVSNRLSVFDELRFKKVHAVGERLDTLFQAREKTLFSFCLSFGISHHKHLNSRNRVHPSSLILYHGCQPPCFQEVVPKPARLS